MGRALVRDPKLFLFDEPLSNLDAKLRVDMRTEIKKLHHRVGKTTVYVTHDQVEAMTLASRIAVMHQGEVQQFDEPQAIYSRPANIFVAGFMGSPAMNFIPAELMREAGQHRGARRRRHDAGACCRCRRRRRPARRRTVILGIRPGAPLPLRRRPPAQQAGHRAAARRRSRWSSRPAPRPSPSCASATSRSSAASTPTTRRAWARRSTLGIDMAHACLFDPDNQALDLSLMSMHFATYPSLADRVVLVTGGASGIGADIVRAFAAQGARVAFLDMQDEAGEALVDELAWRRSTGRCSSPCDITDIAALRAAIADACARGSARSRVLVNNAANDERHAIDDVTAEYWDRSAGHQPAAAFLRRPGGAPADEGARLRLDHQLLLDRLALRGRPDGRLCHRQGRGHRPDPRAGRGPSAPTTSASTPSSRAR